MNGKILDTPGPGTYKAPSPFDKFRRLPQATSSNFFKKRKQSKKRKSGAQTARSSHHQYLEEENRKEAPVNAQEEL